MDAIGGILVVALLVALIAGVWQRFTRRTCPACHSSVPRKAAICAKCRSMLPSL
jgi:predicted amidophosphoribosyltransferase